MRILLVRPPVPEHTIGLKHVMVCEPLELEYVAAGAEGHEIKIFDMILEKGLDKQLRTFRPDIVATSCSAELSIFNLILLTDLRSFFTDDFY